MDIKFLFLSGHLKDEVFVWELIEDVAIVSVYYSTLFEKEQKLSVSEGVLWHGKHTWEGGISILPGSLQIVDNRRINPMKISTWRRNGWGQIVNYTLCIWKPWGDLHLSMKWQSERWQPLHGYEMWRWQKYVYDAKDDNMFEYQSLARNPNKNCVILALKGPSISSHTLCINITIW